MRAQTSPHPHRRWWRCLDKDRTRPPSSRPTKTHTPSKLEKEPLNSSDISCDRNSERQPCSVSARDLSKSSRVSLSWVCCFCFLQLRENRRQVAQFASHLQFGRGQDLIVVVIFRRNDEDLPNGNDQLCCCATREKEPSHRSLT
ncbi:uncharacterized protein LOC119769505 isoform X3 [Culex quinquefasciatus]|uniref:uncharacterized protein LOC119769505 isoform X3 n=1 Tax=Culex quinquefasciatus TaxID=7176 RepID=UPI0018E379FE|nr:uncharacterized protein LOC119769505 isoform X3 [Culex quinquefasciatus]